jgi:uncharacterized protein
MFLMLISLVALAAGPLLFRAARTAPWSLALLDGFVVMAIVGLVMLHILPHAMATVGLGAVMAALVGLLGPGLLERWLRQAARQTHSATVALAIAGLIVHAFFDGIALSSSAGHGATAELVAMAVVLHRLPVAITVWWILSSEGRIRAPVAALTAMGVATVAGYSTGGAISDVLSDRWVAYVQSLVAGSVLHVVFHRPHPAVTPPASGRWRIHSGVGALVGLALVALLSETHLPLQAPAEQLGVGATFFALALESAPALLLALAMAGLVQVFLPRTTKRWMTTGRPPTEALRGMVFGLPLPICSCGVIPLYQTLVRQQVPATAGLAFLVATPELGLDAILISLPLLGGELAAARVGAAAITAFVVGWLLGRLAPRQPAPSEPEVAVAQAPQSWLARVHSGLRFGFGEIVDHTGPWLLLGLGVASLAEPMLRDEWLLALPLGLDVIVFALVGMPSYVCASGATPFVAILIHKGVSPGAALAFLLTGPATNVTTFGVLARLHGRRFAGTFGAAVAALSILLGLVVNWLLPTANGFALHEAAHEEPSAVAMTALAILAATFLASLLRQGPRGFLAQILAPYGGDAHCGDDCGDGHDHGHDHDHDRPSASRPAAAAGS